MDQIGQTANGRSHLLLQWDQSPERLGHHIGGSELTCTRGAMNTATASTFRRVVLVTCLALAVSLISPLDGALRTGATAAPASLTAATTPTVAAATAAAMLSAASPPNRAHPFSDPIYSPFRTPTRVNCVRTNCPGPYHGFWAIDFVDTDSSTFDPVYAAGAGIFHIGAVMGKDTCASTNKASSGTWVWIDHGGSRTTMYTHLYQVNAREGQLVTPATMIGRMGHNGNRAPCKANYLHMEFRVNSIRVEPPSMFTCVGTRRVTLPQSLGYPTWNQVPTNQNPVTGLKPNVYTPRSTNACMP
jgi:murein DD-endopeptidase MepM/ murein hydrolase activator NlpD